MCSANFTSRCFLCSVLLVVSLFVRFVLVFFVSLFSGLSVRVGFVFWRLNLPFLCFLFSPFPLSCVRVWGVLLWVSCGCWRYCVASVSLGFFWCGRFLVSWLVLLRLHVKVAFVLVLGVGIWCVGFHL